MWQGIAAGLIGALKGIVVSVFTEKFFVWLFFFAGEMIVKKTPTKIDDQFLEKAKELYEQSNRT